MAQTAQRTRASLHEERIANQDSRALVMHLEAEVARLQRLTPVFSERSTQTQLQLLGSGDEKDTATPAKAVPATACSTPERSPVWAGKASAYMP